MREPNPVALASKMSLAIAHAARAPVITHLEQALEENRKLKVHILYLVGQLAKGRIDKSWLEQY